MSHVACMRAGALVLARALLYLISAPYSSVALTFVPPSLIALASCSGFTVLARKYYYAHRCFH